MAFTAVEDLYGYTDYPGYSDGVRYYFIHALASYNGTLYLSTGGSGLFDMGDVRQYNGTFDSAVFHDFGGSPEYLTGTVTSVDGGSPKKIFTDTARTEADGFFETGTLSWTAGAANAGQGERTVVTYANDTFTADRDWPNTIQVGDPYQVTYGAEDVTALYVFSGLLFAGVSHLWVSPGPPSIWAYDGATWSREAVLEGPDASGLAIDWGLLSFFEHDGELYAGTWIQANITIRIWHRVNNTTWEKAYEQGAATRNQETMVWAGASDGTTLYTGDTQGGLITYDGASWTRDTTTFDIDAGTTATLGLTGFALHESVIYASGSNYTTPYGVLIYRLVAGTWTLDGTLDLGFVDPQLEPTHLISHNGELWCFVQNYGYRRDGGNWTLDTTFPLTAELMHRAVTHAQRLYVVQGVRDTGAGVGPALYQYDEIIQAGFQGSWLWFGRLGATTGIPVVEDPLRLFPILGVGL